MDDAILAKLGIDGQIKIGLVIEGGDSFGFGE